jgi:hypothetical protein
MDTEIMEIECPVCDRKVRTDAPHCPHCGAEFVMSGIDELEKVVREINGYVVPEDGAARRSATGPAATASAGEANDDVRQSKGFLGRLFRKRH